MHSGTAQLGRQGNIYVEVLRTLFEINLWCKSLDSHMVNSIGVVQRDYGSLVELFLQMHCC